MRAVLNAFLIFFICTSAFCGCVCAFDGDGSESHPYLIQTASDLKQLASDVNSGIRYSDKYFKVTSDIDLAGVEWIPIGRGFADNKSCMFTGTFDGDGHTISNLYVNNPEKDYQGLFGNAANANFKNLNLINVQVTGNLDVGGVVGVNLVSSGTHVIENCCVMGNVSGKSAVGGVVGYNYVTHRGTELIITNSVFNGNVIGSSNLGGVSGLNIIDAGKISIVNCYTQGEVRGDKNVSGIAGVLKVLSGADAYVSRTSALNQYVSGYSNVGRVVGGIYVQDGTVELNDNYGYDKMINRVTGSYFTENIAPNEINGENTNSTEIPEPIQSPVPVIGLLIGLGAAAIALRKI